MKKIISHELKYTFVAARSQITLMETIAMNKKKKKMKVANIL